MKQYELIIETTQPNCGGKPPKVHQFVEVQTDDPVEYVRQREPNMELNVYNAEGEDLTIIVEQGMHQVKYVFTEV